MKIRTVWGLSLWSCSSAKHTQITVSTENIKLLLFRKHLYGRQQNFQLLCSDTVHSILILHENAREYSPLNSVFFTCSIYIPTQNTTAENPLQGLYELEGHPMKPYNQFRGHTGASVLLSEHRLVRWQCQAVAYCISDSTLAFFIFPLFYSSVPKSPLPEYHQLGWSGKWPHTQQTADKYKITNDCQEWGTCSNWCFVMSSYIKDYNGETLTADTENIGEVLSILLNLTRFFTDGSQQLLAQSRCFYMP